MRNGYVLNCVQQNKLKRTFSLNSGHSSKKEKFPDGHPITVSAINMKNMRSE